MCTDCNGTMPTNINMTDLSSQVKSIYNGGKMAMPQPLKVVATQSTNSPQDVEMASSTNVSEPVYLQRDEIYFPIDVNIPSPNGPTPTGAKAPLTEEEKRRRSILVASGLLLALIVLVAVFSMRKN